MLARETFLFRGQHTRRVLWSMHINTHTLSAEQPRIKPRLNESVLVRNARARIHTVAHWLNRHNFANRVKCVCLCIYACFF